MRIAPLAFIAASLGCTISPSSSSSGAVHDNAGGHAGAPANEPPGPGSADPGVVGHGAPPISAGPLPDAGGSAECSTPCNGTCVSGGRCLVTLAEPSDYSPGGLAVDGTNVYWGGTTYGIVRTPLAGGALVTLATGDAAFVALDATNVYWTAGGPSPGVFSGMLSMPIGGGAITTLTSLQGEYGVGKLAAMPLPPAPGAEASRVCWNTDRGVQCVPAGGGAMATVSGPTPPAGDYGIAVDATRVYWTDMGDGSKNGGSIHAAPLDGSGPPVTLATGQYSPMNIAVDTTNVYWTASGSVVSVPVAGGSPTTIATGQANPGGIASDGSAVYWVNWGYETPTPTCTGSVVRASAPGASGPTLGGAPVTLASGLGGAAAIAVDATSVYFTTSWLSDPSPCSDASVRKLTPK